MEYKRNLKQEKNSKSLHKEIQKLRIFKILDEYDELGMIESIKQDTTNPQFFRIALYPEQTDNTKLLSLCRKLQQNNYIVHTRHKHHYAKKVPAKMYYYDNTSNNTIRELIIYARVAAPNKPSEKRHFPSPNGNPPPKESKED